MSDRFRILDDPIDPADSVAAVRDPECGALATFLGTARRHTEGREVVRLEYEVHESMALRQFEILARDLRARHAVARIAIDHRRGIVPIGEVSVAIAVSAPRRRDALAACAEAIERLKQDIPIWKREVFADGARWVEGS